MTGLTKRVGVASVWAALTRGSVYGLSFLSILIMARLLTPADFGLVATGSAIFVTLFIITELAMADALIAHRDPTREHLDTAWTLGMIRASIMAAILALATPWLAQFFEDDRLIQVLWVFALLLLLTGFINPRAVMLRKKLIFWQDFAIFGLDRLTNLIVSVAIAYYYRSYWALVLGLLAGQIVLLTASYSLQPYRPRISLKYARELLGFSIWLMLARMIDTLSLRLDMLLVAKFLGPRVLGVYTVGENLASIPIREPMQSLATALFPALAQMCDDPERMRSAFRRVQMLLAAIALPIGFGIALTSDLFVSILLGEKWLEAVLVIQVLAVIGALQSIEQPVHAVGMATGATRLLFWRSVALLVTRIPMVVTGIMLGGLAGLLCARFLAGLISILANTWVARKLIGIKMLDQIFCNTRSYLSVAIMTACVWFYRSGSDHALSLQASIIELIFSVAIGAVAYFAAMFGIWRLMGMPQGPEHEIILLATKLSARLGALRKAKGSPG